MNGINTDEEDPEEQAREPCVVVRPESQHELGGGEVGCDGNGVVEPVVPRQREAIRGRDEERGVCRE